MYTGLRFKGIVKEQFRKTFELIAMGGDWENSDDERFREFGNYDRASFIPMGILCYMPWDDDDEEFIRSYDKETGRWVFQCSLKNYNDTIEKFLDMVPYFMESVEFCEVLYEEWGWSAGYELVDDKMVETQERFLEYC
jgi:hypothetical protein